MNPRKALLVAGIPQTCNVTEMEEALWAGLAPSPVGRVQVALEDVTEGGEREGSPNRTHGGN